MGRGGRVSSERESATTASPRSARACNVGPASMTGTSLPNTSRSAPTRSAHSRRARRAVGGRVQVDLGLRAASRAAPRERRRSSWTGRAAGEDREDDVDVGVPLGADGEPGEIRRLHLSRVVDDRRPPRAAPPPERVRGRARVDEQHLARVARAPREGRRAPRPPPARTRTRPRTPRGRRRRQARGTARPRPRATSRCPRGTRRGARGEPPSPGVGGSEMTATSVPSRVEQRDPLAELVVALVERERSLARARQRRAVEPGRLRGATAAPRRTGRAGSAGGRRRSASVSTA